MKKERTAVTAFVFAIGVKNEILAEHYYDQRDLLEQLGNDKEMVIQRSLCILRNTIMRDYGYYVDNVERQLGKGLDKLPDTAETVKTLRNNGVCLDLFNKRVIDIQQKIEELITRYVTALKKYFASDIDFSFIRELIVIPGYKMKGTIKTEANKLNNPYYFSYYPFGTYIHIDPVKAADCIQGLIVKDDLFFLNTVYALNGEHFETPWNHADTDDLILERITDFIYSAEGKTNIYVDSENVCLYQLYAMLESLDQNTRSCIDQIAVIRDINNHPGWNYLSQYTGIPVVNYNAIRVLPDKSTVDAHLMLKVQRDMLCNNVSNIILISSDVDFTPLITEVSADYMVFYQKNKTADRTLEFYRSHDVTTIALGNFAGHKAEDFKRQIFRSELYKLIVKANIDAASLAEQVNTSTAMHLSSDELENYIGSFLVGTVIKYDKLGKAVVELSS